MKLQLKVERLWEDLFQPMGSKEREEAEKRVKHFRVVDYGNERDGSLFLKVRFTRTIGDRLQDIMVKEAIYKKYKGNGLIWMRFGDVDNIMTYFWFKFNANFTREQAEKIIEDIVSMAKQLAEDIFKPMGSEERITADVEVARRKIWAGDEEIKDLIDELDRNAYQTDVADRSMDICNLLIRYNRYSNYLGLKPLKEKVKELGIQDKPWSKTFFNVVNQLFSNSLGRFLNEDIFKPMSSREKKDINSKLGEYKILKYEGDSVRNIYVDVLLNNKVGEALYNGRQGSDWWKRLQRQGLFDAWEKKNNVWIEGRSHLVVCFQFRGEEIRGDDERKFNDVSKQRALNIIDKAIKIAVKHIDDDDGYNPD
jgi:hypothetical protein